MKGQEIVLRDYQEKAIDRARVSLASGKSRIIIPLSCGSGKTVIAGKIAVLAHEKGKKVLFLVNRRELVFQAKKTFEEFGLRAGIVMAGEEHDHDAQIQIASMQTYVRRMDLEELRFNYWWHKADLIFVDECHSAISPSYQKILKGYDSSVKVIGLTATPCRSDGRGLGEYFQDLIATIEMQELIDTGVLVPFRYFAPYSPDMTGVGTVAGDWNKGQADKVVNRPKLIGDIYENWSVICPERQTILFANSVKHSIALQDEFLRKGVTAQHIDANTHHEERAVAFEKFLSGKLQVIVNVGIACEGTDLPPASCIGLARPTKSLARYIQMVGRGSRTSPGKLDCAVLDFAGNLECHGYAESPHEWTLDGRGIAWKKSAPTEREKRTMKCSSCGAVLDGLTVCPDCGSVARKFGRALETQEGELVEVGKKEKHTILDKQVFWGMLEHVRAEKNYNSGWTSHKYRERFGVWPKGMNRVVPIEPDLSFKNYMKHLQIKYAKSKARRL